MFYQIDDKFYVKMSNYYQELEVIKNLIVPLLQLVQPVVY